MSSPVMPVEGGQSRAVCKARNASGGFDLGGPAAWPGQQRIRGVQASRRIKVESFLTAVVADVGDHHFHDGLE